MRPNPYKQARSRQYLAKQRAKYGKKAATRKEDDTGTVDSAETPRKPRWLRNLPSNIDRYQEDAENQADAAGLTSTETNVLLEDYDFSKSEDISRLVEEFTLGTSRAVPSLAGVGDTRACPLYDKITKIDIARLEQAIKTAEEDDFGAEIKLPGWFLWNNVGDTSLPETRPLGESRSKHALSALPAAIYQSRLKANKGGESPHELPRDKEESKERTRKSPNEEFLDSILD